MDETNPDQRSVAGQPWMDGRAESVTLFLGGDVMTGRGIDQIMPQSVDPGLHEPYVRSARTYVELAERANGPIPRPVAPAYIWGDALDALASRQPDVRVINLETAVTNGGTPWPHKGIHYRMHPANVDCLLAAGIDCCVLANNHVLDWSYAGLSDTLAALAGARMATAGAGEDVAAASAAAVLPIAGHGRVLVFAFGHLSGGIPPAWAAGDDQTGVSLLSDLSVKTATGIAERIDATARDGDRIVVSVHWGGNWGYEVPARHREFAHALIDEAGVDVVHGHSSHHPKAVEVYRGRPILYGCGDLLNDYEGIEGHETYRGDLTLMYFLRVSPSGGLVSFELVPLRIERFQLRRAAAAEARWLTDRLDRECRRFGGGVALNEDRALTLEW